MINKQHSRTDIRTAIGYALDIKNTGKSVAILACNGIDMDYAKDGTFTPNVDNIENSFKVQANLNPRVEKPIMHIVLSWPDEDSEKLTAKDIVKVSIEFLNKMGYGDTQYMMVSHTEKNNIHVHIVANVVDNNGRRISDYYNYSRAVKICKELTKKYGYSWGRHKSYNNCNIPNDSKQRTLERAKYDIAKCVMMSMSSSSSIEQMADQLEKFGIGSRLTHLKTGEPIGISFNMECATSNGKKYKCTTTGHSIGLPLSKIQGVMAERDHLEEYANYGKSLVESYTEIPGLDDLNILLNEFEAERERLANDSNDERYIKTVLAFLYLSRLQETITKIENELSFAEKLNQTNIQSKKL